MEIAYIIFRSLGLILIFPIITGIVLYLINYKEIKKMRRGIHHENDKRNINISRERNNN